MSEYITAAEKWTQDLDAEVPNKIVRNMSADHDRIRALEAENARLREALGEAIDVLSGVRHNPPHYRPTPKELDDVMPRLKAAL